MLGADLESDPSASALRFSIRAHVAARRVAMPTSMPEPVNWNEVKVMLEAQGHEITVIAEGFADVHPRIVRIETAVASLVEDMKLMIPAVQSNTKDSQEIKKGIERLEGRLTAVETR